MKTTCPHCSVHIDIDPETHAALQAQTHFQCPGCNGSVAVPPMSGAAPPQPTSPAPATILAQAHRGLNRNMLILGSAALLVLGGLGFFLASRSGSIANTEQKITNEIIHNLYFQQLIAAGSTTGKDLEAVAVIRPYGTGFIGASKDALGWDAAKALAQRAGAEVLEPESSPPNPSGELTRWIRSNFAAHLAAPVWVGRSGQPHILNGDEVLSVTTTNRPRKVLVWWRSSDLPQINPDRPAAGKFSANKVLICIGKRLSAGYVHDNIAASVSAVREICTARNIATDIADSASVFTPEIIKQYKAVIFPNPNSEIFEDASQSETFTAFVENGGGFVGIHSACASESNNPDFKRILGGSFKGHIGNQSFTLIVTDKNHPATAGLPPEWKWKDEGYLCDLVPGLHVLLEMDTSTVPKPPRGGWPPELKGNRYPLAWCHEVGMGRSFYTALGHDKGSYADPLFRKHLEGGILWVLGLAD